MPSEAGDISGTRLVAAVNSGHGKTSFAYEVAEGNERQQQQKPTATIDLPDLQSPEDREVHHCAAVAPLSTNEQ